MLRVGKAAAAPDTRADVQSPEKPPDTKGLNDKGLNEIARDALSGNPLALRRFLGGVAPIVRRIGRGVMGRDNPELEDAIQEALIEVARALPQFRFESDVSHYVAKIAMRRAIASRKRASLRLKQRTELEGTALLDANRPDQTPEMRVSLLRDLIDELSDKQASVVILRLVLGFSMEEIAKITGVSINTVKTRLRLGKNRLRRWLARRGEGRVARD
jgi:RNA polymerase sigma factor (sigma-70 family)